MRASPGAAALLLTVLLAAATPAIAGQTVLTSRSPYWKVGERDDALSRACALNRFNMEEPERLEELASMLRGEARGATTRREAAAMLEAARRCW